MLKLLPLGVLGLLAGCVQPPQYIYVVEVSQPQQMQPSLYRPAPLAYQPDPATNQPISPFVRYWLATHHMGQFVPEDQVQATESVAPQPFQAPQPVPVAYQPPRAPVQKPEETPAPSETIKVDKACGYWRPNFPWCAP